MSKELKLYQDYLGNWSRELGPKPTINELKIVHEHVKPGSKDALAVAMALRASGVTQAQIIKVLGKPHRNKITKLVELKVMKRIPTKSDNGHVVYKVELRAKPGRARLEAKNEDQQHVTQ